jgi:hypothetical protein
MHCHRGGSLMAARRACHVGKTVRATSYQAAGCFGKVSSLRALLMTLVTARKCRLAPAARYSQDPGSCSIHARSSATPSAWISLVPTGGICTLASRLSRRHK